MPDKTAQCEFLTTTPLFKGSTPDDAAYHLFTMVTMLLPPARS